MKCHKMSDTDNKKKRQSDMRLDKFISECGIASRKECSLAARRGRITVNGETVKRADLHIDEQKDKVTFDGQEILYRKFTYVLLNKPSGYISATEDGKLPVVTELLSENLQKIGLFPCGRLDRDTLGLMLLTNDGELSHFLLSPKHHVKKKYAFECESILKKDAESIFFSGMEIDGGVVCREALLECDETRMRGFVTLSEGKYHQIKRMFEALGNKITYLERVEFAGISLDLSLGRGEWRLCTEEEISLLRSHYENRNKLQ